MHSKAKSIAFFDFDGTITRIDTVVDFIKYMAGKFRFVSGVVILLPFIIGYGLKILTNKEIKEKLFVHFFKGIHSSELKVAAEKYALKRIPEIERPEIMKKIQWHKKRNHEIVVVSASMEDWIAPWCKANDCKYLANTFELVEGKLTGKLRGLNCHGKEKAALIKQYYALNNYDEIYAYGDSKSDLPMIELANNKFYKEFS